MPKRKLRATPKPVNKVIEIALVCPSCRNVRTKQGYAQPTNEDRKRYLSNVVSGKKINPDVIHLCFACGAPSWFDGEKLRPMKPDEMKNDPRFEWVKGRAAPILVRMFG